VTANYEVGVVRELRAIHVMSDVDGPEGKPHAHDYRVEVRVSIPELDERGMALDLVELEAALDATLSTVRDADLEQIRPSRYPGVTVEIFARWVHDGVIERVGHRDVAVRIWEHDGAFAGYGAAT
jgi:6-pyruvoyltetrahydropterin/6-carboxytetrahydropterin synthase